MHADAKGIRADVGQSLERITRAWAGIQAAAKSGNMEALTASLEDAASILENGFPKPRAQA